jgi:hypothetical protein
MPDPSAPLDGAREAPLTDVELVLYNHYRHLGCLGTVDPDDPEDCANVAVESIRALRAASYAVIHVDPPADSDRHAPDDMPVLRRRMLTMLLDQMGPEAMGEVLAERGLTLVKDASREFGTPPTHERWVGQWVPVSGEGNDG